MSCSDRDPFRLKYRDKPDVERMYGVGCFTSNAVNEDAVAQLAVRHNDTTANACLYYPSAQNRASVQEMISTIAWSARDPFLG